MAKIFLKSISILPTLFVAVTSLGANAGPTTNNKSSAKKAAAAKTAAGKKKTSTAPKPSPAPTATPAIDDADEDGKGNPEGVIPDDAAEDSVDKPIPRSKIESSDAPADIVAEVLGAKDESEIAAAAEPFKPTVSAALAPAAEPSPATAAHSEPTAATTSKEPVSAEQSLKWLVNGNTRFVSKTFRADGRSAEDRVRTSVEQKPHAIILACSESITPPELIFDQGIGEISVVRVAGPAVDTLVVKSLEQAVQNYGSQLILVLGHTQCSSLEGSPYIGRKQLDPGAKNEIEAALNADGIARSLAEKSAFLKTRIDAGQLSVKSALYWVDTGKVKFY